jgi:hypothetical protein
LEEETDEFEVELMEQTDSCVCRVGASKKLSGLTKKVLTDIKSGNK